jgi:hypothetical protein
MVTWGVPGSGPVNHSSLLATAWLTAVNAVKEPSEATNTVRRVIVPWSCGWVQGGGKEIRGTTVGARTGAMNEVRSRVLVDA